MEQTSSMLFWLNAGVGGLIVLLHGYLADTRKWLPGTVYFSCAVATVPLVLALCYIFKQPINPDTVTNHVTLALAVYGIVRVVPAHQAAKAARAAGVDKGTTDVTGS